jgi:hypothetical protein
VRIIFAGESSSARRMLSHPVACRLRHRRMRLRMRCAPIAGEQEDCRLSGCASTALGKTMLARRLPSIMPTLTPAEILETTRIYSALARLKPDEALQAQRPFRSPHTPSATPARSAAATRTRRARSAWLGEGVDADVEAAGDFSQQCPRLLWPRGRRNLPSTA